MHKKAPPKKPLHLDTIVPKNPRYRNVQAKLNTGVTVNKVKFATAQVCAKRRNEIFFRLNRNQLYELYNEYESGEQESIIGSPSVGSPTKIVSYTEYADSINIKPYLILDVREPEEFCSCHLLQARSFPYTMMR